MKEHFKKFAHYNRWANIRLYENCSKLSPQDYLQERQAFFTSIHGTLNHLLVADKIWLGRLKNINSSITALDQILFTDFTSLLEARKKEDEDLIEFINTLDANKLNDDFSFVSLAGKKSSMPLKWVLTHLFNHQTHHRGQVHTMLSQAGAEPPAIDLYYFLLE